MLPNSMEERARALISAQIVNIIKLLAGNDKRLRDKGVKKLRKWLMACSSRNYDFTEEEMMRIWKGLFYNMWMSDKPLVQEELSETVSSLIHCINGVDNVLLFIKGFFKTIAIEWFGIDQLRLDKFQQLMRRFLRQSLEFAYKQNWDNDVVEKLTKIFKDTLLSPVRAPHEFVTLGVQMHFVDIYMEELSKVGRAKLSEDTVYAFLQPFVDQLAVEKDSRLRDNIVNHIFKYLMRQSDQGIDHEAKIRQWKRMGKPKSFWENEQEDEDADGNHEEVNDTAADNSPDEMQDDEDKELEFMIENGPKDPRAGKVNVILPQIEFDANRLADVFWEVGKAPNTGPKNRKIMYQLSKDFRSLATGVYTLGIQPSDFHQRTKFDDEDIDDPVVTVTEYNNNPDIEVNKKKKKLKKETKHIEHKEVSKLETDSKQTTEKVNGKVKSSKKNCKRKVTETGKEVKLSTNEHQENGVCDDGGVKDPIEIREPSEVETGSKQISEEANGKVKPGKKKQKRRLKRKGKEAKVCPSEHQLNGDCDDGTVEEPPPKRCLLLSTQSPFTIEDKQPSELETTKVKEKVKASEDNFKIKVTGTGKRAKLCTDKLQENGNCDDSVVKETPSKKCLPLSVLSPFTVEPKNNREPAGKNVSSLSVLSPFTVTSLDAKCSKNSSRRDSRIGTWEVSNVESGSESVADKASSSSPPSETSEDDDASERLHVKMNIEVQTAKPRAFVLLGKSLRSKKRSIGNSVPSQDESPDSTSGMPTLDQSIWKEKDLCFGRKKDISQMKTPQVNQRKKELLRNKLGSLSAPSTTKRVNFALSRNTAQDTKAYHESITKSPAIPFDASKKPSQGVLKPSPVPCVINPFYKLSKKRRLAMNF